MNGTRDRWLSPALAVATGVLLTLSFAPFRQAWLGWVALAPLAFIPLIRKVGWKEALVLGGGAGWIHFASVFFWLTEVTWLGWAVLCLYLALYPAVWFWFWTRLFPEVPSTMGSWFNTRQALAGACAWVVLEWFRGWFLTGFGWNTLAVSQASMPPILQIADLGGGWIVSGLVAHVSLVLALTVRRFHLEIRMQQPMRPHFEFSGALALVGVAFVYGVYRLLAPFEAIREPVRVLAVQPDIAQDPWSTMPLEESLAKLEVVTWKGLAQSAGEVGPLLVVWPETPVAASVFQDRRFFDAVDALVREPGRAVLLGSNNHAGEEVFNAAVLVQERGADVQVYHKNHLVIMGEYVPLRRSFPLLARFVPPGRDFSAGEFPGIFEWKETGLRLAPLICFEDTVPRLVRRTALLRPEVWVNLTNDGWFGRSAAARQHFDNAILRCVETRIPMLRVTNTGVSGVISERGVVEEMLGPHRPEARAWQVRIPVPVQTVYTQWGDVVVLFFAAGAAGGWGLARRGTRGREAGDGACPGPHSG